ncbi:hypothetical protein Tco_0077176 [Tanacetum coccineum]
MAEENVPAPTRTDEQLVPVKARLPIGKSNLLMDLQKMQKNLIFRLSVDILQNTNFFSAFTASADVPSIYIQQFVVLWESPPRILHTLLWHLRLSISAVENHFVYDQPMLNRQDFCRHNIHKRPQSPLHITAYDYSLSNFKFIPKGELDEVFGMPIPKDLITDVIRNSEYYQNYLEMAARKPYQATTVTDEEGGKKKKAHPTGKSKRHAPTKQPAPGKRSDHLVDEADEEPQPVSEPQVEDDEYNLQREIEGKGKGIATDEQAAQSLLDLQKPKKKSTTDRYIFQRQTPATQDESARTSTQPRDDKSVNVVCDTSSPTDADTGANTENFISKADTEIFNDDEEHGKEVSHTVTLDERMVELDEGQAGSDPENPPSSFGTLSLMKNLNDALTFGDQFLDDKPTKEEPCKANVETEVESVTLSLSVF